MSHPDKPYRSEEISPVFLSILSFFCVWLYDSKKIVEKFIPQTIRRINHNWAKMIVYYGPYQFFGQLWNIVGAKPFPKCKLYVFKFLDVSPRMLTWVFTSTFWSWLRPHKIGIPGCAPHQLLGDAPHIDASASQAASLNKAHLGRGVLTKGCRIA